jgi:MoxR-like ATPase
VTDPLQASLARIDAVEVFGSRDAPTAVGDDRRGHYWLITEPKALMAVKIALITGRPLLVEGPSGSGKSALARAVSESLGWTYYETVVTSQTRLEQLTGWVDLVQRLHHAEVAGRRDDGPLPGLDAFVQPGVLWWALDPASAAAAGPGGQDDPGLRARTPVAGGGAVVLVDEIDKAEPDLPNNLLVPLGSWELRIEGRSEPVGLERALRPLVIVTSNRERDLPPAFLRRCVTLELGYPTPAELIEIASRHVPEAAGLATLVADRLAVDDDHRVSPAEFIDAVRAAAGLGLDEQSSRETWEAVRSIVLGTGAGTGLGLPSGAFAGEPGR